MTGFELKVWRRGMEWTQERAAEELGVSTRAYQLWEKASTRPVKRTVALATKGLSVEQVWPDVGRMLTQLSRIARH